MPDISGDMEYFILDTSYTSSRVRILVFRPPLHYGAGSNPHLEDRGRYPPLFTAGSKTRSIRVLGRFLGLHPYAQCARQHMHVMLRRVVVVERPEFVFYSYY
ncbi:unnamed protein product [Nesidiocoris tenuis]|uniref:Uncharacterized protein n=1 Tax=Nesidiocoris tenuis TaxID=355587 RepID=A0A6H5H5E1_9HEMI|nr:unnamed protein product [Nesidiocoris tenuis]